MKKIYPRVVELIKSPCAIIASAICCFLFNALSRYPGILNPDSKNQYEQALTGQLSDWHPPIMAWFWSQIHFIADGSGSIFLFHVTCYWLGFSLIALTLNRIGRIYAAGAALLLGLFPTFLMLSVQIHKDVGLAVSLLLAFAVVFFYRAQDRKIPVYIYILIAPLLFYATLVRANGIFGVAAILLYAIDAKLFLRPVRAGILCLAVIGLTLPLTAVFNHAVLGAQEMHPMRSVEIYDVAGVARFSGDLSVFGSGNSLTQEEIRKCYTPSYWDTFTRISICHQFWDWFADKPEPDRNLTQLWLSAIAAHPFAYLYHRILHFNSEIFFIVPWHHADWNIMFKEVFGIDYDKTEFSTLAWQLKDLVKVNPVSAPAFTLAIAAVLLILSWPVKKRALKLGNEIFALSLASITYSTAYFIVGCASDIRYHYWGMMAAFLALIFYMSEKKQRFYPPTGAGRYGLAVIFGALAIVTMSRIILGDAFFH